MATVKTAIIEKANSVNEVRGQVDGAQAVIFADYRGLTVKKLTALRKKLRESNSQASVYKNTLIRLAYKGIDIDVPETFISGPTLVVSGTNDAALTAKALVEFLKDNESASIKGGYIGATQMAAESVRELAKLPSRNELIAKTVGQLKAPINQFVLQLSSPIRGLVYVLQAIREKK